VPADGQVESAPTCFRHTGRETWVRCTRCERPICPDCMREAAVGFQCPECVSEGVRTVREPRTAFGGRVSGDTSRVSIALIGLNVAVYVLGLVVGETALRRSFGNVPGPALLSPGGPLAGVAEGEYYRLVTAAFLHAGVFHLALNMFALAVLGPPLESALGRVRFLALYLLSALGGSVAAYLLAPANTLGVGASGAIFGLFGAYYVVVRRLGGNTGSIVGLLAVNLVITFAVPFIDWRAHLGGLVTGALISAALAYAPRDARRTPVQAVACIAVAALLVVLVIIRTAALTG
jgi:membrane associated rhomboid family serine protease